MVVKTNLMMSTEDRVGRRNTECWRGVTWDDGSMKRLGSQTSVIRSHRKTIEVLFHVSGSNRLFRQSLDPEVVRQSEEKTV